MIAARHVQLAKLHRKGSVLLRLKRLPGKADDAVLRGRGENLTELARA
jgi:hypothetical protein